MQSHGSCPNHDCDQKADEAVIENVHSVFAQWVRWIWCAFAARLLKRFAKILESSLRFIHCELISLSGATVVFEEPSGAACIPGGD
jgi:hypothetical protein